MSNSFTVPTSVKMRLCQPAPKTLDLATRLEACGASWVALHARNVSSRRRRHGAADLAEVRRLKDSLRIPVISNGNVRVWDDLQENRRFTGADGLMVGESLLGNPWYVVFLSISFPVVLSYTTIQSFCEYNSRPGEHLARISGAMSSLPRYGFPQDRPNSRQTLC
jgi:tRNA-dihydrouridine synthase